MKNTFKILAIAAIIAMAGIAEAQDNANTSATVSATVVVPIAISKTTDMALGRVIGDPNGGNMAISADGSRNFSNPANSFTANPNGTPATFHVTGDANCTFSTSHSGNGSGGSSSGLNLDDGNSHTMWFTFDGDQAGQTLTNGSKDITVTGTLSIGTNQAAGSYTGSFTELVTYE